MENECDREGEDSLNHPTATCRDVRRCLAEPDG
eukprot:COSAG01_NODE_70646_length_258_cov_0.641509_1_plen_32_part_01